MAHAIQDGEEENYWPGFVDALTTMVMVLTFIMMVLGLTVFSLSQNVSKSLLAEIARATNVDVTPSDQSADVAQRIVTAIAAQKRADIDGQKRKAQQVDAEKALEERSQREALLVLPGEKQESAASANMKPLPAGAVAGANDIALTIVFQPNAAAFDEGVRRELAAFANRARDGEFIIRAYAVDTDGTMSEARRLAYYRAMLVRQDLIKAGLRPGQLLAQIDDSTDLANRSIVRILAVRKP